MLMAQESYNPVQIAVSIVLRELRVSCTMCLVAPQSRGLVGMLSPPLTSFICILSDIMVMKIFRM